MNLIQYMLNGASVNTWYCMVKYMVNRDTWLSLVAHLAALSLLFIVQYRVNGATWLSLVAYLVALSACCMPLGWYLEDHE